MRPVVDRLAGMRISCPESLFEIAMIGLLLQNTTIHRTISMFTWLMDRFGKTVNFDNQSLKVFFTPNDLIGIDELVFRNEGRFGYRSKFIPEFAKFFAKRDDEMLRMMSLPTLLMELGNIKGVGPYTSGVIVGSALRDKAAIVLDVWNRKIIARRLLDAEDIDSETLKNHLLKLFGDQAGLAVLYLTEYEFLDSAVKN